MKRCLLCILFLSFILFLSAQPRYWVGISGGLWSATANWSTTTGGAPGASSPATANDVIFDNGFNGIVQMDVLSTTTFTINSLLITANSTVTLQCSQAGGGERILQVASISTVTPGLKINSGSTLIMDAVNASGILDYTLALTGGTGVTGEISGNLYIKGTGAGTGDAEIDLQDDATHFAALTVKNGGVIKYYDDTGNTSPATGSYLTMENGSVYEIEKNGGSFPTGSWNVNSLAKVYNAAGANPPLFNGTVYGNLEWDCPAQINYSLTSNLTFNNVNLINTNGATAKVFRIINSTSSVRTLTINGSLTISSNSILEINGSGTATPGGGKLHLKGNLVNAGSIISNGAAGTINEFELNGVVNQYITQSAATGILSGALLRLIMNNPAGATLLSPVTLSGILDLRNGTVKTTAANILTMNDNGGVAYISFPSATSFVDGPMRKVGSDPFTFPIGKGGIFAKITIYPPPSGYAVTDTFTAEYFRGNPQTTFGVNYQILPPPDNIDHISYVEYWSLQKNAGPVAATRVEIRVSEYSFCYALNTTFIARLNASSQWINTGTTTRNQVSPTPPYIADITSQTMTELGIFTLATSDPFSTNPLPITLVSFDAAKLGSTKASVNWELAACCSAAARFEIERAGRDRNFSTITTVEGSLSNRFYTYTDNGLKNGINYYRLKMIDEDGKISYSRTVAIMNGVEGLVLTSLVPTVITGDAALTISSSGRRQLDLVIVDMQGRVMQKQNHTIAAGNTSIRLSTEKLGAGVYQLTGITAEGKTNTIRFIKQ